MLYITNCRMFKIGLLCEQRKTAAFKNHLHFHVVLIKANVLHLFGDWKSSVNTKRVSFPRVYFNMEGTAYVCAPLMTAIFSIHVKCMEVIKVKMCTVVVAVVLTTSRRRKMLEEP